MTRLPISGVRPTLGSMAMRRSHSAFLGAFLAVIALFGIIAVSGWHNAIVHDDDAIHVGSIEHDHAPTNKEDPDAPIHLLAHAMGQWVSIAGPFATPIAAVIADRSWSTLNAWLRSGIDPAELLRPPQS